MLTMLRRFFSDIYPWPITVATAGLCLAFGAISLSTFLGILAALATIELFNGFGR